MPVSLDQNTRALVLWLYFCAFMVFGMIIIGAITRLTESGLSITEWKPVTGILPPLNSSQWAEEFQKYQQSPEFLKKNTWMELSDFKAIFFWEWLHRFWGRMIGIAFAVPLLVFWIRGMIPTGYKLKFIGLLILGGAQGVMGWYMVMSGLIDVPAVSHFRLAAHLGLALLILISLLLTAFSLSGIKRTPSRALFIHGVIVLIFVITTLVWGAFTAGLDAGLVYNETFPKMGGQWIPPDFWAKPTVWGSILTHHSAVQFTHRWLAISTVVMVFSLWVHALATKTTTPTLHLLMIIVWLQAGLGIATLLSGINLPLATLHQAGAVILLSVFALFLYQCYPQASFSRARNEP